MIDGLLFASCLHCALKKSLAEKRKPATVAMAVAGGSEEQAAEPAAPKKRARKTS